MDKKLEQIGLIGLGKMGLPLARNMNNNGFHVSCYDLDESLCQKASELGLHAVKSIAELISSLPSRKVIWMMIPAGRAIDASIHALMDQLSPGDIIIDGGNSNFNDSLRRHELLKEMEIGYLDCGTSGGVGGALHGVCTMIGGESENYEYCKDLFDAISVDNGSLYCGEGGSGHFVKMVHNGIEYGMMQAIGEGFELMEKSNFNLNLQAVAKVWNHGSVIRSWLIELTQSALLKDPKLDAIKGIVNASGEGLWTIETALKEGVPTPVIALSLIMRHRSQQEESFSAKVLAALRNEFGGHAVVKSD